MQERHLDVLAIHGDSSPMLQLHKAVVQSRQADSGGAGADSIRVISALPTGAHRVTSPHSSPGPVSPEKEQSPTQPLAFLGEAAPFSQRGVPEHDPEFSPAGWAFPVLVWSL